MDLNDPISAVIPSLEGRVLQVLTRTTMPLSGSRVATLIPSASNAGVRNALRRLEDQGLVLSTLAPPALLYVGNRRHLLWPAVEQLVGAVERMPQALTDLIATTVREELGATEAARTTVALYGSTARGDNRIDSDIDLLLVTASDEEDEERISSLVIRLITDVQHATGNETNVYVASRRRIDELRTDGDPMITSWQADARTLVGPDVVARLNGGPWRAS